MDNNLDFERIDRPDGYDGADLLNGICEDGGMLPLGISADAFHGASGLRVIFNRSIHSYDILLP